MQIRNTILITALTIGSLHADQLDVEKDELKFGFIKLTDCAPIVIAKDTPASATFEVDVQKVLQNNGTYLDITQLQNTQDHSNNANIYGFLWNNLMSAFRLKD